MKDQKLQILCLEDNAEDAIIIRELLSAEGLIFQFDHVLSESDFTGRLKSLKYDIVLSDYNLPGFSGIAALLLSKKICPDVPFICISGTIGEDLAVELMHLGASDYILKDRLFRLPSVINRALDEYEVKNARILAENELRESREKYKNLVENINDVVYEIDNTGKITYMSPIITEISGFPDSYYTGKSLFKFINEKDLEITREKFENIIFSGMINPFEFRISDHSDNIVWLRTSSKPVLREGKTIGIRGTAVDITKNKMADEQIRKLSRAMEQSPASVIITDRRGIIEYVNPKFTELTGYSLAEAAGKTSRLLKSGYTRKEDYENLWKVITSGGEWRGEFHNKRKDGSLYWEQASISPIKDSEENITHFLAVKEDITERKKLTDDLIEAKARAEASDKLKTAFLNNISHEVRTPLNGILGFSEFVLQTDIKQEEKESYLEILNESSDRLVNTITNYMDMSLIVSGNMSVKSKPVDLPPVLEKIYQKFLPKCIAKNLEFVKQIPDGIVPQVLCDEVFLEKSLSHLLDNAIKFTLKGSITLGINFNNTEVDLFVNDTGSGIDPVAQSTVFQIFTQADVANTRGYEGSGLGLSIAKGLVELMGGRIRMKSEKGKGSSFCLTFPNVNSQNSDVISPDKTEAKTDRRDSPIILITEDDESNATLLGIIFDKAYIKFLIAKNGMEAVDLCLSHPEISLVLMDIKMPVMDGLIATRKIKEFSKNLPIIGVTAYAMTGDKEKALEAGCDEYLTKPLKSDLLLATIKKLL